MRSLVTVIGVLLLLPAADAVTPAAARGHFRACSGGYGPDGSRGDFYRAIRAKRVGCTTARRVTRAWVLVEAMSDGANPTGRIRVRGYTCRGRATAGALSVLCTRGARAVTFVGHP